MLTNRNVLLGVSGGIAAYKAIDLASRLAQAGASVRVILTEGAQRFVTPLSFRAITGQPVHTSLFESDDPIPHISLTEWADIFVVTPATADVLSRLANGAGSDLLSAAMLSAQCPRLLAPAMNTRMYANQAVQANLETLRQRGFFIMESESGRLACGAIGKGRLPAPAEIADWMASLLAHTRDLEGVSVLVTAGACRESLDPMRFLSNHSSGRMGLALARAAHIRGAQVTLVHAHTAEPPPYYIESVPALDAARMHREVTAHAPQADIVLMVAAVSDYTFSTTHKQKMKKGEDLHLPLTRTKDILSELGANKPTGQLLVGFAAESENVVENGRAKLERKRCDFVAANDLRTAGQDDTRIEWVTAKAHETLEGSKLAVAHAILSHLVAARE
ncbi:MAG: bifunctional phosphopantothenoylcysteine decarboxylase/phosphopantothenate--cysteine ligase CoaBC [Candidatus Cloacimonetes bacterium]|nr:bifunctional phosphopantothenoylcysteine decarboxylase/phosphopantothenate--cysteine ligase CoaBC [Candidatus Cloacimonadota bacterium]